MRFKVAADIESVDSQRRCPQCGLNAEELIVQRHNSFTNETLDQAICTECVPKFVCGGWQVIWQAPQTLSNAKAFYEKGICLTCGVKVIGRNFLRQAKPLTNDNVYHGTCIRCNQSSVPADVLRQWQTRKEKWKAKSIKSPAVASLTVSATKEATKTCVPPSIDPSPAVASLGAKEVVIKTGVPNRPSNDFITIQLRKISQHPSNKKCADCNSNFPLQYINTSHCTFVCRTCASIHREHNHKVKSLGHSFFTSEELEMMCKTDNLEVNALWLAR